MPVPKPSLDLQNAGSEMRCYVSKKTLAQACCLSVILIFILTFVPFSLTNAKEKAAFVKNTKGKLLVVQSGGTKLLARPQSQPKAENVRIRLPVETKKPEQVKVMTSSENKNSVKADIRPPVENKIQQQADVRPAVESKITQQADVKPPVENKILQQANIRPSFDNKIPQQADVILPVENKVPQQADVRPPVENKIPQQANIRPSVENEKLKLADVRPSVENKVPQQVDIKPPVEHKIPQDVDVRTPIENKMPSVQSEKGSQADVRSTFENKNPALVKEKSEVVGNSQDTQQNNVDMEKSSVVTILEKPYSWQVKSSVVKASSELNEKKNMNKEVNIASGYNKTYEKPVPPPEKNGKEIVSAETKFKIADSNEKNVRADSSTAESSNPPSVKTSNKTDIKGKLINLNVKDKHPVSVIKLQNKVLPVTIPSQKNLQHMERDQLEELYFLYIENLQTHCVRQRHIGNEEYGGYHICEDVMNHLPCLVYSFGRKAENDVSFDHEVARQYGCDVHLFNPLNNAQRTQPTSSKMTFHSIGLNGEDDPVHNLLTLSSIKTKLNHKEKQIDILKLDIESGEWGALEQMCKGHDLENVTLLIVEFHVCTKNCMDTNQRTKEHYIRYLSLLKQLYDLGYRIYFFRMWPACAFKVNGNTHTACHDVHMVRNP